MTIKCPYCNADAVKVDSSVIYGRSFGDIYMCSNYPKCDSYVGCHEDGRPKGSLANPVLRKLRTDAHEVFDYSWQKKLISRTQAYKRLALYLGIDKKDTHIGGFDDAGCKRVLEFSSTFYTELIPDKTERQRVFNMLRPIYNRYKLKTPGTYDQGDLFKSI